MNIAILDTGLFPDRDTTEEAITHLVPVHNVYRYDLRAPERSEADWDQLLDEVLAADRVFSI